jgi:hypothetical protein
LGNVIDTHETRAIRKILARQNPMVSALELGAALVWANLGVGDGLAVVVGVGETVPVAVGVDVGVVAGPDCRLQGPGSWRSYGVGGCPIIAIGIAFSASVKNLGQTFVPAPDNHFGLMFNAARWSWTGVGPR